MDTVEGTLIVRTVVKWFSDLAKGGRQLEPYGSSGRKHKLSYEKPGITIVRRPLKTGASGTGVGRSEYNPKIQLRIEPRIQHNDARKRNITISPIPWWVSIGHKGNYNHRTTTIRQPE